MTVKYFYSKRSFAGGEVSPLLAARADLAVYEIGAKELTNFLVLPQGGIFNRPGTRVAASGPEFEGARLVPFSPGAAESFCLVFRPDGVISVYQPDGAFVTDITGSPYDAEKLKSLRWLQSIDVLYLFNKRAPVHKLQRISGAGWVLEPVKFKNGPFQDFNTDDTRKMTLTGDALSSDFDFFEAAMAGSLVKLELQIKADSASQSVAEGTPWVFTIFGAGTIETRGNWTGTVTIERMGPDDDDFVSVRTWPGDNSNNFGYSCSELEYGVEYRVSVSEGSVTVAYYSGGGVINRVAEIVSVTDARNAEVTSGDAVQNDVPATDAWAMGAFSEWAGYPAVGIFHQERLALGNTPSQPQTIWMSQSASWENFGDTIPAVDSDAITVTLAARQRNEICGFSSRDVLLIFTDNGEWAARAGQKSDVLTPSSVVVTPYTYHGSIFIEPLDIGSNTLFVQSYGRVVRSMGYKLDIDGYDTNEISILAEHLTEGTRIKRWVFQTEPWPLVWIALENGVVLSVTVQQEQQVSAWSRHVFNAQVDDIASVGGKTQDEIFMLSGGTLTVMCHREDSPGFDAASYLDEGLYPYESVFESLELEGDVRGSLQGRPKQVSGGTVRLFSTGQLRAGMVTENSGALDEVIDTPDSYTGDVCARLPGGMGKSCRIRAVHDAPGPVTVLGFYLEVTVHEQ